MASNDCTPVTPTPAALGSLAAYSLSLALNTMSLTLLPRIFITLLQNRHYNKTIFFRLGVVGLVVATINIFMYFPLLDSTISPTTVIITDSLAISRTLMCLLYILNICNLFMCYFRAKLVVRSESQIIALLSLVALAAALQILAACVGDYAMGYVRLTNVSDEQKSEARWLSLLMHMLANFSYLTVTLLFTMAYFLALIRELQIAKQNLIHLFLREDALNASFSLILGLIFFGIKCACLILPDSGFMYNYVNRVSGYLAQFWTLFQLHLILQQSYVTTTRLIYESIHSSRASNQAKVISSGRKRDAHSLIVAPPLPVANQSPSNVLSSFATTRPDRRPESHRTENMQP